ncbi:MAG: hypothetical protein LBD23_07790 [Oscillospiraceae bacterium]|jgi:uncharacterized protein YegL|nr:hypothetical protein [Oscillospiraceae bacterium]
MMTNNTGHHHGGNFPRQQIPHYSTGSFAERLHSFGSSTLFLIGIILFSVGALLNVFASFSVMSVFTLILYALPITGFWLIYASSKTPRLPEKVLPSLTLFKVSVIIELTVMCLVSLAFVIVFFILVRNATGLTGLAIFILFVSCVLVVYIYFYYRAILNILKDIKTGINSNCMTPLRDVKLFTIITYITVGFSALFSLVTIVAITFIRNMVGDLLQMLQFVGMDFVSDFLYAEQLASFFSLMRYAGIIVCLIVLNRFNNSLRYGVSSLTVAPATGHAPVTSLSCSICGTPYDAGDAFCEDCGQKHPHQPLISHAPPSVPIQRQAVQVPQHPSATLFQTPPPPINQPRMLLVFLLDTSVDSALYINQLNDSLNRFKAEVGRDVQASSILDVAVVQYNDSPYVLHDFVPVGSMKPIRLITGGSAVYSQSIREVLRMVESRTRFQTTHKPWIILISGSNPVDDIAAVAGEIQAVQNVDRLRFMALSVGGRNVTVLKQLTDVVFRLDDTDFAPFFNWIGQCIWAISKISPGEKPQLPPLEGNVYRER